MPIVDPFASFDPSPYQTAPQLPLQTLVALANALGTRLPKSAPPHVQEAEKDMRLTAQEAGKAMVMRLRETNQANLAADLVLDNAMDGLFTLIRDDLRGYRAYQRPGLDFLQQDPNWQLRLEDLRENAQKSRRPTHQVVWRWQPRHAQAGVSRAVAAEDQCHQPFKR